MNWKYRLVIYGDSGKPRHYRQRWVVKDKAIVRAKRLIQIKGIEKIEVLPRGLAHLNNEVVVIQ